ncbi:hypothetical protein C0J45_17144 [Silurus meridionalis]|nr:hypothetical protein C0J45_17144 [Silurus meridionalis]
MKEATSLRHKGIKNVSKDKARRCWGEVMVLFQELHHEMYPQRRVREEPQVFQQIPKSHPREATVSRGGKAFNSIIADMEGTLAVSLRKSASIQNMAQTEVPWEGVTLNRCLFIAITILVLSSGFQRLHDFVRGRKDGTDLEPIGSLLNVRHTALRKHRLPVPEPETSLWDTFFWWVSDDEEEGRRGKSRKVTREKAIRGLRHKAIPDRKLLKDREGRFKARRGNAGRAAEKSRENVKPQQEKVKRLEKLKKEEKEKKEKVVKKMP